MLHRNGLEVVHAGLVLVLSIALLFLVPPARQQDARAMLVCLEGEFFLAGNKQCEEGENTFPSVCPTFVLLQ